MRVTRLEIQNFRSIRHLVIDLSDTTVLLGPNNTGKTAILDALRITLARRRGVQAAAFTEHDVHLPDASTDPRSSEGVSITVQSVESEPDKWPEAVTSDLADIVQINPATDRKAVLLRARYKWNPDSDAFETTREFLDAQRSPLGGKGAHTGNLERFRQYLPMFYLGALRDASDEFSTRSSQFWRRLLSELDIPPDLESRAQLVLESLNEQLRQADPRLAKIAETLSEATRIAARERDGGLDLRMVPFKTRELLLRAEIILRNDQDLPWLPLRRQGQGIQSLSVIFLFQAFIDHLLRELYKPQSEPVLALEEPETHLHPQAVRTLWRHVDKLPGQKIISTHSPFFVQHVPFRDLQMVRLTDGVTTLHSLPERFAALIPAIEGLNGVVAKRRSLLTYEQASGTLTVHGALNEKTYRKLLAFCGQHERQEEIQRRLRELRDRSSLYIDDDELQALETFARRMRGEIFFAVQWLLVEGQADFLIVHAVAHVLEYDFDQHGVAVIDAKNNGNPATFVALARALDIPWYAVFDGDEAGKTMRDEIAKRVIDDKEMDTRCLLHEGGDLEAQLVADGLESELQDILKGLGNRNARALSGKRLAEQLRDKKTAFAAELAARFRQDTALSNRAPAAFRTAIRRLRELD